jgi:hypothetical protein
MSYFPLECGSTRSCGAFPGEESFFSLLDQKNCSIIIPELEASLRILALNNKLYLRSKDGRYDFEGDKFGPGVTGAAPPRLRVI